MTDSRKWYLWPQGYREGFVPWFVILRRMLFWPLLFIGKCLVFVAVVGGFGLDEAIYEWRK